MKLIDPEHSFIIHHYYRFLIWLIAKLAGDMPIVLNVNISRPKGYTGALVKIHKPELPGIFSSLFLYDKENDAIVTPRRDVKINI